MMRKIMRDEKKESNVRDRTTENGKKKIGSTIHGPTPVEGFPHKDSIFFKAPGASPYWGP